MNENQLLHYLDIGLPEDVLRMKLHGDFDGAIRLIDMKLQHQAFPEALRCCLLAEREIMLRTPAEFPFTKQAALDLIRESITDYTDDEFEEHIACGQIRWIYVNGEMRIFKRFFESMCKSMPDIGARAARAIPGGESNGIGYREPLLNRAVQVMKEEGSLSKRIRIHASVKVKEAAFTEGMFVRVHLPIPALSDQQSNIRIEKIFPENGMISPEDAPQRTICWEENMNENHEFIVEYSYVHTERYCDAEHPEKWVEETTAPQDEVISTDDTAECHPHIVFTPYIRALVEVLSEGCDTPLEKARRFYDYITTQCKYTFVPAYFTMESIAENCARTLTGDCGVFALLFITMCRCADIPAQWQSGLVADPEYAGAHDWARFYVAPFGWLRADLSFGVSATRVGNEERRRFYFGNLDPYRMIANRAFQAPFTIEKKYWRADPYDNQVGEIETAERGLRSEEYESKQEMLMCEDI